MSVKVKWNYNTFYFLKENQFDIIVREMVAILSGPQCVNYGAQYKLNM